jgi:membrane protease YdiL (CAAX protease family)
MSLHEEKPPTPGDSAREAENQNSPVLPAANSTEPLPSWGSVGAEPAAATEVAPYPPARTYPEDLQISWSWGHLILFGLFALTLFGGLQVYLLVLYSKHRTMSVERFQQYLMSKPEISLGSTLVIFALLILFLYVTLALWERKPFWSTLGWRKLVPIRAEMPKSPFAYFFTGCGLSILVFGLTAIVKPPENTPIEEVFKFKETAMLFVAMAVFVAPLVEETLFRGYLYPLFARSFGVTPAILVTGVLFGLMHGAQLGWTWGLVAMLTMVGIVFTLVRARTGTVFASFLMHLGYNSLIGLSLILETHGFTKMPTGK